MCNRQSWFIFIGADTRVIISLHILTYITLRTFQWHSGCGSTWTKHQCNTAVKPDAVLNGVTLARSHLQVNSGVRSASVDRSIPLQQEGINLVIVILIVIFANNQCSVWEMLFWSSKSRIRVGGQRIFGYSAPNVTRIPQRRAASVACRRPAMWMFPRPQLFVQNMLKNFQVSRSTFDEIWSVRSAVRWTPINHALERGLHQCQNALKKPRYRGDEHQQQEGHI